MLLGVPTLIHSPTGTETKLQRSVYIKERFQCTTLLGDMAKKLATKT